MHFLWLISVRPQSDWGCAWEHVGLSLALGVVREGDRVGVVWQIVASIGQQY